jgi:hypothetical protein
MADDRNSKDKGSEREKSTRSESPSKDQTPGKGESPRKKSIQPRRRKGNNFERLPSVAVGKSTDLQTNTPLSTMGAQREYSSSVLSAVDAVSGEQPNEPYEKVNTLVNPSSLLDYLIECTFRYIELRSMSARPLLTEDDVRIAYRYFLAARIAQVSGYRLPERAAELRYPAVLGPFLASIGRYIHPTAAYEISPTFRVADPVWDGVIQREYTTENGKQVLKSWYLQKPQVVERVLSVLVGLGCPDVIGLPADTLLETDEFFRLENSAKEVEALVGSGDFTPSAGILLSRALVELSTLAKIYGQHKVVYVALSSLYSAVDKLARDSFSMGVGGTSPR